MKEGARKNGSLLALSTTSTTVVDALGDALPVSAKERLDALVHLDAGQDVLGLEDVYERSAIIGLMVQVGTLQEDNVK